VSSILDIDLDYFRFLTRPLERLNELLGWAGRPVDAVFDHHQEALELWNDAIQKGVIRCPQFILHVDEHHDMMGERPPVSSGNFVYFAMRRWLACSVHWLVDMRIDSPNQWLSAEAWESVAERFTSGSRLPRCWPKPDLVTVAISPGFLSRKLRDRLMKRIGYIRSLPARKVL